MRMVHRRTLAVIFDKQTRGNLKWREVESMFRGLGAEIHERRDSSIVIELNGEVHDRASAPPAPGVRQGPRPQKTRLAGKGRSHTMIDYKGYTGVFEYDDEYQFLAGRRRGQPGRNQFRGPVRGRAERVHEAQLVDDYLGFCEETSKEPSKPYSGRILVRVDPVVHRSIGCQRQRTADGDEQLHRSRCPAGDLR